MNILKKTIYFILSIQEKVLTKKLNKTLGIQNKSKHKKFYQSGCLLTLDSLGNAEQNKMEEELLLILKSANYDPEELVKYIKKQNTEVYFIDNIKKLNSIGFNEGFIYPLKGHRAICISLLLNKKISLKSNELFILPKGDLNKYYFIYHFYNWYAFKHGIAGIDNETQELLNKYLYNPSEDDFSKLQLEDIYKLKDAIKQDKASIEFVFKLCKHYEASKKALEKLKNNGANL